ncbi:hypothetical protein [Mesobacillus subterraneus]|uniref:Phage tail assembly protein n=1 Tax=Mesobacillus subterraneus TaxID=285983 RepID=A0A3R9FQC6_9BACI|nr:hypothetical protein [Mesobacillus subterraneus]RSD21077.1 hypothetical protein EJA10_22530 [Mesobacillus subterraneus]
MPDKNDVVIIELDRPRELRFGHKALKKLSALTGKSLEEFEMDGNNLEELEKVMYCALMFDAKENNETLKLEEMEDLLDYSRSFKYTMEKLQEALESAFGSIPEDVEKN